MADNGTEYVMSGPTQTRVWDFMRTKTALKAEQRGMKFGRRSVIHAATSKGYVPAELVGRGNLMKRREIAIAYMEYVTTLLTAGGNAQRFGEEIVTGKVKYAGEDKCGCPEYKGTDQSEFIQAPDSGVMCIHPKGE